MFLRLAQSGSGGLVLRVSTGATVPGGGGLRAQGWVGPGRVTGAGAFDLAATTGAMSNSPSPARAEIMICSQRSSIVTRIDVMYALRCNVSIVKVYLLYFDFLGS